MWERENKDNCEIKYYIKKDFYHQYYGYFDNESKRIKKVNKRNNLIAEILKKRNG